MFRRFSAGKSEAARCLAEDIELLHRSPLVDPVWYRQTYAELRNTPIDVARHYLEHGAVEGRNPGPFFDTKFYLKQNPDVVASGINPLVHYLANGGKEGRHPHPLFDTAWYNEQISKLNLTSYLPELCRPKAKTPHDNAATAFKGTAADLPANAAPALPAVDRAARFLGRHEDFRVLFISPDSKSPSHVYRVDNMARGLQALGCKTETVLLPEFQRVIDRMSDFHAAIFWRIAIGPRFGWSADVERAIRDCENCGVAVFFDVDDLVFDPELCNARNVDGLRYLNDEELVQYHDGVRGYRDLMLRSGNVLVPTDALKQYAEKFGVRAFVVPNGLHEGYEEALAWPLVPPERKTVIIGYAPGSRTHQKDFATAEPALRRLLDSRPNIQLRIIGPLDLSEFPALQARIGSQVFVTDAGPLSKLFRFNQQIDINLAPLELNNPYTAAKSELKYFEAAVFGVPTVASRVGPYCQIVRNGENGYAVETEAEWFAALTALVDDPNLRQKVGAAARAHVEKHYMAPAIARKMIDAFEDVRAKARGQESSTSTLSDEVWPDIRDYRAERPIVINWFVPGLIIGGGGHRSILRLAYHLSRFGHRVRLYFTDIDTPVGKLRELLHEHFYPLDCPIFLYDGTMRPADVVFATYWTTVAKALSHRDVCPNVFYFVQDFEPFFFPMGSDYILAENTYRQGLYSICSAWCAHFLRTQFNCPAGTYIYPIKKEVYHPRPRAKQNLNIVFFAKPEMPRRCYSIGVDVLKEVHALRPDIEIITYGSGHVTPESLPFPATCRGVLPTIDDLAEMFCNADLGIVFSTTNPSLVPYEMLACGLPVVDIDRPGTQESYGGRRDIVLLGAPLPSEMASQIVALLDDPAERARRSRAGLDFIAQFPDETGMVRRIESLIVDRLRAVGAV